MVGRIGRAVGLRGEVEVVIISDDPHRFEPGSSLLVAGGERVLTVEGVRAQGKRTIVSFAEVSGRTEAEALRGAELVVARDALRPLGPDEFWDDDLIGSLVVTASGEELGRVGDVLHAPENDVLVVEGATGQRLIPLTREIIRSVQPRRRITISPIPGLLD